MGVFKRGLKDAAGKMACPLRVASGMCEESGCFLGFPSVSTVGGERGNSTVVKGVSFICHYALPALRS